MKSSKNTKETGERGELTKTFRNLCRKQKTRVVRTDPCDVIQRNVSLSLSSSCDCRRYLHHPKLDKSSMNMRTCTNWFHFPCPYWRHVRGKLTALRLQSHLFGETPQLSHIDGIQTTKSLETITSPFMTQRRNNYSNTVSIGLMGKR